MIPESDLKLVSILYILEYISDRIRKNIWCPPAFRLGSGAVRIQAYLATLIPRGTPSRLGQLDGPVHGLSAGGQLSKAGGRVSCT